MKALQNLSVRDRNTTLTTVLGAGDARVNKADYVPGLKQLTHSRGNRERKSTSKQVVCQKYYVQKQHKGIGSARWQGREGELRKARPHC